MDRARAPQAPSPSVASLRPNPTDFRGPSALLPGDSSDSKSSSTLQSSIIAIFVVITSFIVLACYTLYKFYKNRQRRRRSSSNEEGLHQQERQEEDDEEEEEDYGPVLDHPIWYIRTAGLQPSVISSITTVRYEKGDGLVEGTHCSVCLNEFQGGESLRLLPKCSHAFHMPCIDTWLSSHTNCPLCRAPIVLPALEETGIDHSDDDDEEDIRELGSDDDRDLETRGSDGVGFEVVIENVKEQEERLMVMEEEMKCN